MRKRFLKQVYGFVVYIDGAFVFNRFVPMLLWISLSVFSSYVELLNFNLTVKLKDIFHQLTIPLKDRDNLLILEVNDKVLL